MIQIRTRFLQKINKSVNSFVSTYWFKILYQRPLLFKAFNLNDSPIRIVLQVNRSSVSRYIPCVHRASSHRACLSSAERLDDATPERIYCCTGCRTAAENLNKQARGVRSPPLAQVRSATAVNVHKHDPMTSIMTPRPSAS